MTDEELIKKYIPLNKQNKALEKLKDGYPVQYIIGDVDFFGCKIKVNENVLIPRFETEYLVEKTINYLKKLKKQKYKVLEIGTGSGCISIALKKNIDCEVDAIDISDKAIHLAKENAINNNIIINFETIDMNNFISNKKYDLIISNPPYVRVDSNYDDKIKKEPEIALFAPGDGTFFYDVILNKIKNNLNTNYLIAFEIGDKQGNIIKGLNNKYLSNNYYKVEKDYNNYERYVFISDNDIL